jgi:hypothetical protein
MCISLHENLKATKDRLLKIIHKGIMGVSLFILLLNLYSFFDMRLFKIINQSRESEIGIIIVFVLLMFIIYSKHGLAKR